MELFHIFFILIRFIFGQVQQASEIKYFSVLAMWVEAIQVAGYDRNSRPQMKSSVLMTANQDLIAASISTRNAAFKYNLKFPDQY